MVREKLIVCVTFCSWTHQEPSREHEFNRQIPSIPRAGPLPPDFLPVSESYPKSSIRRTSCARHRGRKTDPIESTPPARCSNTCTTGTVSTKTR